jgi:hypothetical protein
VSKPLCHNAPKIIACGALTMTTLLKLSPFLLMMSITVVSVLSYFVSLSINGIFGRDGFGTIGNMVVLTFGFFGTFMVAEYFAYPIRGLQMHTFFGVAGALTTFTVLAILKLGLERLR